MLGATVVALALPNVLPLTAEFFNSPHKAGGNRRDRTRELMRLAQIWSHFVFSERGECFPFADRSQPPVDYPFDPEKCPSVAGDVSAFLDESLFRRRSRRLPLGRQMSEP
jgi:hypothetical protein